MRYERKRLNLPLSVDRRGVEQQMGNEMPKVGLYPEPTQDAVHVYLRLRVPGEIKRREVMLDPQVGPEEIMSREVELGCESWTSFASGCSSTAVQRTLSL